MSPPIIVAVVVLTLFGRLADPAVLAQTKRMTPRGNRIVVAPAFIS
jgi:hypothetical protein